MKKNNLGAAAQMYHRAMEAHFPPKPSLKSVEQIVYVNVVTVLRIACPVIQRTNELNVKSRLTIW